MLEREWETGAGGVRSTGRSGRAAAWLRCVVVTGSGSRERHVAEAVARGGRIVSGVGTTQRQCSVGSPAVAR